MIEGQSAPQLWFTVVFRAHSNRWSSGMHGAAEARRPEDRDTEELKVAVIVPSTHRPAALSKRAWSGRRPTTQ
ncbi:hypothetical protein GCM10009689_16760 [Brevibacterium antiquum]